MQVDPSFLVHARDVAVEAAEHAARVIRAHSGRLAETIIREKALHDLVTHVDEEAQRRIIETLGRAFPDHDILAEEGADDTPPAVAEGFRWIVDPLDGTTNFTHDVPPYAVSIALQDRAEIVVGVVLDVSRGELFTATRGGGTFRNGARVGVSRTTTLGESLLTTGFPYRAFGHVEPYLKVLRAFMEQARGVRRPGSAAVDLAYVACGRFDGFFETGLSAWDVAAGTLLVEEAGGRVTDFAENRPCTFTRQILASNGPLHPAMLDVVAPLRTIRA